MNHSHSQSARSNGVRLIGTRLRASVAVFALFLASTIQAAPYKPSGDTVLLELDGAQRSASAALKTARVAKNSTDPHSAAAAARQFIALGRAQHDERFFGYASAALQNWRDASAAPTFIALLRADIAQHQHRFVDALGILDRLIARDDIDAEAHLMRATLLMTLGRPHEARKSCQRLFSLHESFAGTVCLAQAASLTGQLSGSYNLLGNLLGQLNFDKHDKQNAWALGIAADMAERVGDLHASERWLRQALAQAPDDLVSRLQLCDVALELDRPREVLDLLSVQTASEPVLLRRALAAARLNDESQAKQLLSDWQAAVARSEQLGVTLHLRELARGQLDLLKQPKAALETAIRNWAVQREPIDARLLLDAATAARDPAAAQSVRDWQRDLRLEDAGLKL